MRLGLLGASGQGKKTLNAAIGNVMEKHITPKKPGELRAYVATVLPWSRWTGIRAESAAKAKVLLEKRFGKGNVLFLHRAENDELPRDCKS